MKLKFKRLGNDLYASAECTCPNPLFAESNIAHLMKRKITLVGCADSYFFDVVNAAPRSGKCHQCGREFTYQWLKDGVEFAWDDTKEDK